MTGFIKYINVEKGYGYISVQERGRADIRFTVPADAPFKKNDTVSFDLSRSAIGKEYAVNLVKQDRNEMVYSTEDKQKWTKLGLAAEYDFVARIVPRLGREIVMNPEKERDKYAIDLYDCDHGRYADLKTQATPFFSAGKKYSQYGYDPQYTVTFNYKDYKHYCDLYPDCDIYFHVLWEQAHKYGVTVTSMEGVWVAPFAQMRALIEAGKVALHPYENRKGDEINAKDSYLFDLNHEIFTRLL